jgi:hypothetical protein
MSFDIRYDRRVSQEFLEHFLNGGFARSLPRLARRAHYPLDLQFRKNPKTNAQHATLYVGLTAVLNLRASRSGIKLDAHPTWAKAAYGFSDAWGTPAAADHWRDQWNDIELYLERVVPLAVKGHGLTEGAVQSAISKRTGREGRLMLDREVVPSFRDAALKKATLGRLRQPLMKAVQSIIVAGAPAPKSFGTECDLLAIDSGGRLLAIEVKPFRTGSIVWVAAQATMYAMLLQEWLDVDHQEAPAILTGMISQKNAISGGAPFIVDLPPKLSVTPVVALQRGASQVQIDRMLEVRSALEDADLGVPRVEIFEVSMTGQLRPLSS